jgi:hypothetical protein
LETQKADPRYPIGKFKWDGAATYVQREHWMTEIEETPARLRAVAQDLSDARLDTPYRENGWTIRQIVHHLPDSHMNAYVRFRLALTEQNPTIKPYDQSLWAELKDAKSAPVAPSLAMLEGLHARWAVLLRSMDADDFARTLHHPEHGNLALDHMLAMYAWHGRHHIAHIASLRERMGWHQESVSGSVAGHTS